MPERYGYLSELQRPNLLNYSGLIMHRLGSCTPQSCLNKIDNMKKILLALLSTISISAFADRAPSITGADLLRDPNSHVISDANSGGGGEDRNIEVLSIEVVDRNGLDVKAKCDLTNDKGGWSTTAPGTVKVLRSKGDLTITCAKGSSNAQTLVVTAATAQIDPKHFRFQADPDDSDDPITVPYYDASIKLTLTGANP